MTETASPATRDAAAGAAAPAARRRGEFELNSLALMASSVVTGVLGLAFWALTARGYPVAEVGRASAVLSSAVMLATLSTLSLGSMFERFLALAGWRAAGLVRRGHAAAAVVGTVLGGCFLLVGPRERLFDGPWELALFPPAVGLLAVFAVQDQLLTGLGVARWAAVKNVVHSAAKLALVVALAATASAAAVVGSWLVPALVASAVAVVAMRRRLRAAPSRGTAPQLPPRRELWAYFGGTFGFGVVGTAAPLVVPLVVVSRLGTEANAYFSLTWALVSALFIAMATVIGPFVAEAAAHPERLGHLVRRFGTLLAVVGLGGGAFLAVLAPVGLGLLGADYRAEGTPLLHLMAVSLPLSVVAVLYNGLARVQRRLRLAVAVQCVTAVVVIGGADLLSRSMGLRGVGVAYFAAEVVAAAVLAVPLARLLRSAR